jgi:hypothetical protein
MIGQTHCQKIDAALSACRRPLTVRQLLVLADLDYLEFEPVFKKMLASGLIYINTEGRVCRPIARAEGF